VFRLALPNPKDYVRKPVARRPKAATPVARWQRSGPAPQAAAVTADA
jgi:hypothetical protein